MTGVNAFLRSGTNLFAGTNGGVFLSTNDGTNWTAVNTGLTNYNVFALAVSSTNPFFTNLFAGTEEGVFLSISNGTSWTAVDSGLTNNGGNEVLALAVSGTNLFAGTGRGVFLSTNNGTSWSAVDSGLTGISALSFAISGSNLFAGTSGGIFLSTDNGASWTPVDSGLTNSYVFALAICGKNLFAGTDGGVWMRPLSEMITGIEKRQGDLPAGFSLSQNYPNPFNPSTVITYQLPLNSHVTLKIYDALGREVQTLVNERQNAGSHSVTFNSINLPSGVYFYRLEAGSHVATKKLLLLK